GLQEVTQVVFVVRQVLDEILAEDGGVQILIRLDVDAFAVHLRLDHFAHGFDLHRQSERRAAGWNLQVSLDKSLKAFELAAERVKAGLHVVDHELALHIGSHLALPAVGSGQRDGGAGNGVAEFIQDLAAHSRIALRVSQTEQQTKTQSSSDD